MKRRLTISLKSANIFTATRYLLLLLAVLSIAVKPYAQDPNFHIYLCFGQSNMDGTGTIEAGDRTTNSRVKMLQDQSCSNLGRTFGTWYTAAPPLSRCWNGLGPADNFGKVMAASSPSNVTIGLVVTGYGGCDIAFFQKGAPLGKSSIPGGPPADIPSQFTGGYAWMLDLAKKAQTVGVIKGMIFHQGETNTNDLNWKSKVHGIVSNLRADLGIGNVPFIAGELLYAQYNGCCSSHNSEVNKLPSLIPNSYVVSSQDLPGKDVAHFTSASYRELGKRYAEKMLALVTNGCTPTVLEPYVKIEGGTWQSLSQIKTDAGTELTVGPHPTSEGTWSWSGCGLSGSSREQKITVAGACKAVATYTNTCGAKSTTEYSISWNGSTSCCGKISSNGIAFCCTDSDPDGDGWGWENNKSCIVSGSPADATGCSVVTGFTNEIEVKEAITVFPSPCKEVLHIEFADAPHSSVQLTILSSQGKSVSQETVQVLQSQFFINTSELHSDLYYLRIVSGDKIIFKKFTKVN